MKKYNEVLLCILVVLFSALLVYTVVKENTYSTVVITQEYGEKININTATADEIALLPKISYEQAERIVEYRKNIRKFETIEDINRVYGIYPSIYKEIKNLITV